MSSPRISRAFASASLLALLAHLPEAEHARVLGHAADTALLQQPAGRASDPLPRGLGWASAGLGIPPLLAPRWFNRFIGVGEQSEDFGVFNAAEFVSALLKSEPRDAAA